MDDPGTQVPTVLGAQGGLLLLAVSDLVSPSAAGPGFLGLGWPPACLQAAWLFSGWPPALSRPVPMWKAGPGEALRARPALQPPGQAPGLCRRAAMLVAVDTALPWGQPAPCPRLPPCRGRTAGQWAEGSFCSSTGSSLSAGRRPGPPTVPGGPGCPALILSPLQPLLSAYPANGSLIGSLGKYFLEHLLHARHCPGPSHGPNRQTPAFVEHTLWGLELPSDL